ncbi:histidine phosphatase superfamily [Diplogelasinospora grovesii]|uniref:3-phytase n=1 Tax=Diplogelasinospora grovesii TaxID=303347 RepID=A0AAN6S443_9PEZI|nr:histidine phosphatase superfamily [Diplogelasinospora grovesii]
MGFAEITAQLRSYLPGGGGGGPVVYTALPPSEAPSSSSQPDDEPEGSSQGHGQGQGRGRWLSRRRLLRQQQQRQRANWRNNTGTGNVTALKFSAAAIMLVVVVYLFTVFVRSAHARQKCDTPSRGYQCHTATSHSWGQYSPFFSVPSSLPSDLPAGCEVSFVQVLSRHGARDPTLHKSQAYNATIAKIHQQATGYGVGYEWLEGYQYTLGADQLTGFGEQEMVNSGLGFYRRYHSFIRDLDLKSGEGAVFVRSAGQQRVVESAKLWAEGFNQASKHDKTAVVPGVRVDVVIPEGRGVNNTLSHDLCTSFEEGEYAGLGGDAQNTFAAVFVPPILERLQQNLKGVNLSMEETVYMMDMCPYDTVASSKGKLSDFCRLFTVEEWESYDYYQTLGKWYGYGPGNPLGATQGVGWVNELVARLTNQPVNDSTSTNRTLDTDEETFPLGKKVYADFSHDNDMTGILAALGLYEIKGGLSKITRQEAEEVGGYAAAWTVPFAARIYVEKQTCKDQREEMVRIVVNDRVVPLTGCENDGLGRCKLGEFVEGLGFARQGGDWEKCFV